MIDKKNNTGYRNSGDLNSGDYNSGDLNSGYRNSGDRNSGDCNSGYRNSGDRNSGDYNSGNYNSGDYNSGYRNSGDYNSGNCNSGDYNSGWFNVDEPKMRFFGKESIYTLSEFKEKFGSQDIFLPLNVWRSENDMTADEKKEVKGWSEMGGYLKTLSYKEAWAKAWSEASQEQKDWYKNLPNFDKNLFFEITGIKIDEVSLKVKKVFVEVDGKKYIATIDQIIN